MSGEARISLFYLGVVGVFCAALLWAGIWPLSLPTIALNIFGFFCGWILIASTHCLPALIRARPDRPVAYLWQLEFGPDYRQRFRESWPILLLSVIFMPSFSAMKSAISLFNDFTWDQSWIELDHVLHGQDPWRLLQPVFGHPLITSIISMAYHGWVLLIYVGTIYFALYIRDRALRVRYFSAYFGIWVVNGVVLATIFASVGPCFAGPLLGNEYYTEQMAYLRYANESFPVMVLDVQQQLLEWQIKSSHGLGRGITAMPSMHVALAFLFYLAIRKVSHVLGIIFFLFLLIILVGSVHLAYHYAVDGYVSLIVTAVVWILSGRIPSRITSDA